MKSRNYSPSICLKSITQLSFCKTLFFSFYFSSPRRMWEYIKQQSLTTEAKMCHRLMFLERVTSPSYQTQKNVNTPRCSQKHAFIKLFMSPQPLMASSMSSTASLVRTQRARLSLASLSFIVSANRFKSIAPISPVRGVWNWASDLK